MGTWDLCQTKKLPTLKNPVFIEGLPGIGNVGKVAVDFLIDELGATKILEVHSHNFPHSVFVNEKNLVELPTIEVYHKKHKKQDLILMGGDVQPVDERSSYEFSEQILDFLAKHKVKHVITLGGIGLNDLPKKPKVYCTGTSKKEVSTYKMKNVHTELYGMVGPIVGVSGLLVGLAGKKSMGAVSLLAETYGHPMYLGIKGARELLKVLDKTLGLKLNIKKLEKEIKDIESEVLKKMEQGETPQTGAFPKKQGGEVNYIG